MAQKPLHGNPQFNPNHIIACILAFAADRILSIWSASKVNLS